MKKVLIRKDSYFDSVFLMLLSKELKARPDVRDASVAMGTPMNLGLLADSGYPAADFAGVGPNDLVVAVDCPDADGIEMAMNAAKDLLRRKTAPRTPASGNSLGGRANPRDLAGALEALEGANLAIISLPGAYAAREARKALEKGLHVMLFSDNVSLDDEIALKTTAREKSLLLMGPDCGTAIINGFPLCFANVVRRGPVGLVAASGTGLQEVSCLLDRFGTGVSQAIGTGGRDLKNEKVGGMTMLSGIEALAADPETVVIAVISKPPAPSVADKVLAAIKASGKPAVVHFIGLGAAGKTGATGAADSAANGKIKFAGNLEETARIAATLAGGEFHPAASPDAAEIQALAERESSRMAKGQKYVRGYFTGGTLADEAWILLHGLTGAAYSNNQTEKAFVLPDPRKSIGHTIVDLGDDVFTVGRPHPMIDPSTRTERVEAEIGDPEIAVMLFDVVLGYGSHQDPAGALAPSIRAAKKAAEKRGGHISAIASVVGTPGDYQGFERQIKTLEEAGTIVMPSNYQASSLASIVAKKAAAR